MAGLGAGTRGCGSMGGWRGCLWGMRVPYVPRGKEGCVPWGGRGWRARGLVGDGPVRGSTKPLPGTVSPAWVSAHSVGFGT
eukprot:scaffold30191_cov96-Isochrysis_galbana.AAC.3